MKEINKDFYLNQIIPGDCIEVMKNIPANSVDLVFADPPYNLQLQNSLLRPNSTLVDGVSDEWDKFNSFEEYDKFTIRWLKESKRVLSDKGTLWVIGSYHNIFRIGSILQNLGFWFLNDIIWVKTNPMPNFRGRRFTNAHETLIWCTKEKNRKNYNFNYNAMKSFNEDLQMRSDWSIPICRGSERIKVDGKKAHSTQKPEALLSRVILSSSKENDIILDPFSGSGTTASVAKKLKRRFIGIEKNINYVLISRKRLSNVSPLDQESIKLTSSQKSKKRIPIGTLLEAGYLKPGNIIFDKKRKFFAKIRVDGSLVTTNQDNQISGSIHSVGATIQGAAACNGWKFWHYYEDSRLVSLDFFREKFRKEKF